MNKVTKYALIVTVTNLVVFALLVVFTINFGDELDVALVLLLFFPAADAGAGTDSWDSVCRW